MGSSDLHESFLCIDPATDKIVARIRVGTDPQGLAVGAGSLWVANGFGHYITRIDLTTGRVLSTIMLDAHGSRPEPYAWCACRSVTFSDGAVWAIAHDNHTLVRIDPRINQITSSLTLAMAPDSTPLEPFSVAMGEGSLWVSADPHFLIRVNPQTMGSG